jgi:UDP-N-acetyl-D-glucosamine dehydrogenase
VWDELEAKGAQVFYHDPYCPLVKRSEGRIPSVVLDPGFLKELDAAIVTTAHTKNVDYQVLLDKAPLVLDTKNIVATKLGLALPLPKNLVRL